MKITEAIEALQRIVDVSGDRDLVVQVYAPGSIGVTPRVDIDRLQAGIDWDSGVVLAVPAERLTKLSPDEVAAIMDSVRKGQSWHAYQREKGLHERIAELNARIAELLGDAP